MLDTGFIRWIKGKPQKTLAPENLILAKRVRLTGEKGILRGIVGFPASPTPTKRL